MHSSHTLQFNENHFIADIKKNCHSIAGVLNTVRKGLRAAAAAKACPNDKEAILRILSED